MEYSVNEENEEELLLPPGHRLEKVYDEEGKLIGVKELDEEGNVIHEKGYDSDGNTNRS